MGCCGGGRHYGAVKEIHKWRYINLADFRSSSCPTLFSYFWLWILAITSVAVYCVDTFTAVNLLAFNKWNSEIDPVVNFVVLKWIFVGCILFSWTLCVYEWIRAIRVMKLESITEDYLDPLAVVCQSIRYNGGWRRFLLFAELTKSNKKATWVAIYVYFERKGALRILAAEGPRNVLNGLTIYSVARANLLKDGSSKSGLSIGQFFSNIKTLYDANQKEGMILASMTFTFIIWFFSMLMLLLALLLWLFYISHHVNKETLTGYCRRKIEAKLSKIIKDKTDNAWAKEEAEREKQARKKGIKLDDESLSAAKRQPTLPVFDDDDSTSKSGGAFSTYAESTTTLPRYHSHSGSLTDEETPPLPGPYSGQSSLLGNGAPMGQSYPISRPDTAASARTFGSQRGVWGPPPLSNSTSYRSNNSPPSSRRQSPPSNGNGAPWRGNGPVYDDDAQEFELQQHTPPGGSSYFNQDSMSSNRGPRANSPPRYGNLGASIPRSMTPGFSAALPPSMMPGGPAGLPRTMTSGAPSMRSHTPGAGSLSSFSTGPPSSIRSQTRPPGPGMNSSAMPSQLSIARPPARSQTPAIRTNPFGSGDEPRPGGGPPGMAF